MAEFDDLPPIALVQMEVRPGRPDLNAHRLLHYLDQARQQGALVVVFSELCLSGYILGDLWEIDSLVEDYAAWSEEVRKASQGLTVLFGNVAIDRQRINEDGRLRKYNAVYVCHDGRYVERPEVPAGLPCGVHPKTLHPNYRFFDDDRHFYSLRKLAQAQGLPLEKWLRPYAVKLKDGRPFRFGVQLCEDMWCQDYQYQGEVLDTLELYHRCGAQAVFNLSASPWTWQKNDKRNRVVRQILSRSPLPFFYVNQVGAQNNGKNIIVFDGDSTAYAAQGRIAHRARPWQEEVIFTREKPLVAPVPGEVEAVYQAIGVGLRHLDHVRDRENCFLVAVSGGIDSSAVACLLARTFGPERVCGVNMPTRFNSAITQDNARRLCQSLGIEYLSCPIEDLYQQVSGKIKGLRFSREAGQYTRLVDENIQARIRFSDILSGLAAKLGAIYTNNGNKTEVALGYATLYGDVNGAVAPIADLYKVQIYELARFLNEKIFACPLIPDNIVSGAIVPSAELSAAQDVTKGLGDPIKYGYHDALLRQMIEYRHHPLDFLQWFLEGTFFERLGWQDQARFRAYFPDAQTWIEDLEWVEHQMRLNYFKRIQAPPIIALSKRAFGFDLRETQMPSYVPRRYRELKQQVLKSAWG
jgi:NAD+ synthase (glutamine-hydrolysing)